MERTKADRVHPEPPARKVFRANISTFDATCELLIIREFVPWALQKFIGVDEMFHCRNTCKQTELPFLNWFKASVCVFAASQYYNIAILFIDYDFFQQIATLGSRRREMTLGWDTGIEKQYDWLLEDASLQRAEYFSSWRRAKTSHSSEGGVTHTERDDSSEGKGGWVVLQFAGYRKRRIPGAVTILLQRWEVTRYEYFGTALQILHFLFHTKISIFFHWK